MKSDKEIDRQMDETFVSMMQIMEMIKENENKFSDDPRLAKEMKDMLKMVDDYFKELPEEETNRLLELYKVYKEKK